MNHETADVSELLDCLSERLPALRQALLADPQAQLDRVELTAGAGLLSKGEVATAVYVIASGLLRATAIREDGTQLTLSEFGSGELAGEMAILTGVGVYSASVSAAQDSVLVRVPRSTFERIAKTAPQVVEEMSAAVWRRIARDQLALGLTRLFGPLQESVLRYVEARVQWVRLQAGETLFSAGDSGRDLYFVLSGRLRALGPGGSVLNEMTRGESIGEIALLTGEPRTATVVAVRDSALVRVSREAFEEIVEKYPKVMQVIAGIVVRRLLAKERASGAPAAGTCIAVLTADPGGLTAGFTEKLVKALGEIGTTLHLTRERVDAMLNQPGIAAAARDHVAGIRLTAWLDEQESRYRFVVCEADSEESGWTLRCLRQADEILLVAQAGSDPEPHGVEKALLGENPISKARQTLVLLHPNGSRLPSGTARWLDARHVQRHFHIRARSRGRLPARGPLPGKRGDRRRVRGGRRARARSHRCDPGAAGGRGADRHDRRHQHGGGDRRRAGDGLRVEGDPRDLTHRVATAQAAQGIHAALHLAHPHAGARPLGQRDLRRHRHRGHVAELLLRVVQPHHQRDSDLRARAAVEGGARERLPARRVRPGAARGQRVRGRGDREQPSRRHHAQALLPEGHRDRRRLRDHLRLPAQPSSPRRGSFSGRTSCPSAAGSKRPISPPC